MTELTCKRRCVKNENGINTYYTWTKRAKEPVKCPHCWQNWRLPRPEPRTETPEETNAREIEEATK